MSSLSLSVGVAGVGDEVVCNSRRPYELMLSNSFKVKSTTMNKQKNLKLFGFFQQLALLHYFTARTYAVLVAQN